MFGAVKDSLAINCDMIELYTHYFKDQKDLSPML